jgi:alanine dehydrogenase
MPPAHAENRERPESRDVAESLLYLSRADVEAIGLSYSELRDAVVQAFRRRAEGKVFIKPKLSLEIEPGHFFQALCAATEDPPIAVTKWVGVAAENAGRGLPNVHALIIVNDFVTTRPIAVLDGNEVTLLRTAAMSALAATYLARSESRTLALIGCGAQARAHLRIFAEAFPGLRHVNLHSRTLASAENLAVEASAMGLDPAVFEDPEPAVRRCNIVVTTVPAQPGLAPFLEPDWLQPGAFAAAVDLGRSWKRAGLRALDILATDDHEQSRDQAAAGKLAYPGPFDLDLAELASGRKPGRRSPEQRTMFLFPGFALGDLAVAGRLLTAVRSNRLGTVLPG